MLLQVLHCVAVYFFLVAVLDDRYAVAQQKAVDLVSIETGDLPIILSAPHGGRNAIPGVPERRSDRCRASGIEYKRTATGDPLRARTFAGPGEPAGHRRL